jgi:hypothetical protein
MLISGIRNDKRAATREAIVELYRAHYSDLVRFAQFLVRDKSPRKTSCKTPS